MKKAVNTAICTSTSSLQRVQALAEQLVIPVLDVETHRYPDGESGVRIDGEVPTNVIVLADLAHPDDKFLPLAFLLDNLRELGAQRITLVAPYLPYLRQDKRFRDGEAITSRTFAKLLSPLCERIVTIDPHLHRYHKLEEIYAAEGTVLTAAFRVGEWIKENVARPVLVGPDSESGQWVERAAKHAGLPCAVLEKSRHGDRDVEVHLPESFEHASHTPVLVDDIISSGHTMAETVRALVARGSAPPVCIGVHAVLADGALELLMEAGAARVVTTNTISNTLADIDVLPDIAEALRDAHIR